VSFNGSSRLKQILPQRLRSAAKRVVYTARIARTVGQIPADTLSYVSQTVDRLQGQFPRQCPICGYAGYFHAAGSPPRFDAECPGCHSLERHRLLFLSCFMGNRFGHRGTLLHFAPEAVLRGILESMGTGYITADISMPDVDLCLDIEDIRLATASIDAIICNHVLEHVDEARALGELFRVLTPGGTLYCMVPIVEGWARTYEDPSITTSEERTLHFGQCDHLRWFGRDFRERIVGAGFALDEFTASGKDVAKYGLSRGETVFICRKPG
jgi:SAM-dependent methyltransferase